MEAIRKNLPGIRNASVKFPDQDSEFEERKADPSDWRTEKSAETTQMLGV